MAETYKTIIKWILAPFAHSLSGGPAGVDYMSRNRVLRVRQDIADADDEDTYTRYIMKADKAVQITAITVTTDTTLALDAVNFCTISFSTGTAGSMTGRDSMSNEATAFTAATPRSFTVVPSTDSLAVGELLSYSKAETAEGAIFPGHWVEVHYNYV